jgi:hypothetical protein
MNNVFQAVNLPVGGQTIALGPVTISAKYPPKPTSKGTMMRNIRVSDASGQIDITLFGESADLPIVDGMVTTFKGPMKRSEYNGTPKLQADKGITIDGAGGAQQAAQASGGQSSSQSSNKPALGHLSLAKHMAEFTMEYLNALTAAGAGKEFAEKSAIYAPQFAAQWFHGEKYPTIEATPEGSSVVEEENPF